MAKICPACENTGHMAYDATDAKGYLCTASIPCPRCARHRRRESVAWGVVAFLALLFGVVPAILTVIW